MAFAPSELSLMAYTGAGSGNHLYWYTNSAGDTSTAANFFDSLVDQLVVGDVIYDVNAAQFVSITANDGTNVTAAATIQPST